MHSDDRTRALRGSATAGCRAASRYGQGGVDNLAGEGFEVLLADQVKANAVQEFDVRQGGFRITGNAKGESGLSTDLFLSETPLSQASQLLQLIFVVADLGVAGATAKTAWHCCRLPGLQPPT